MQRDGHCSLPFACCTGGVTLVSFVCFFFSPSPTAVTVMLGQLGGFYNLSRKLSSAGMPSFSPLRLRVSATTWEGRLALSKGSPGRICQWSNTHWGKAWPPVLDLRSAVKPGEESRDAEMRGVSLQLHVITSPTGQMWCMWCPTAPTCHTPQLR